MQTTIFTVSLKYSSNLIWRTETWQGMLESQCFSKYEYVGDRYWLPDAWWNVTWVRVNYSMPISKRARADVHPLRIATSYTRTPECRVQSVRVNMYNNIINTVN